jgi:hypothetical protein
MYNPNDLKKPYGFVRVVRMLCRIHTNPVLRCFVNQKELSCEDLLYSVVPELATWLTV